jgi:hypothetical protein
MLTIINRLFREITLWLKLEHKNIVPLWGVADGFGSLPALVSPWLENGALTGYLQLKHKTLSYNEKFALVWPMFFSRHIQHAEVFLARGCCSRPSISPFAINHSWRLEWQ